MASIKKLSSQQFTNLVLQIGFWGVHTLVVTTIASTFVKGSDLVLRVTLVSLLNGLVFYSFYTWLIPHYAEKNRFVPFTWRALGVVFFAVVVRYWLETFLRADLPENVVNRPLSEQIVILELPILFTVGTASIIRLVLSRISDEKKLAELALLQAQTELKFLQAQINPHFLFNTINNIYALAVEQSPQTPDVILKLSALLRYMLYESNEKRVSLVREVDIMLNYISLYEIKYEEPLAIQFELPLSNHDQQDAVQTVLVMPLIFINLLENAFKHSGIGDVDAAWIKLSISLKDQKQLIFAIQNSKYNIPTTAKPFSGIGIANLKRQLELQYGNAYDLTINDTDTTYSLVLKLPTTS